MAIAFIQKRKKQTYLIIALVIIVLVITVVLRQGFLKEKKLIVIPGPLVPEYPKIEINFGVLEKPELIEFIPFEEIFPFEEEVGRENPFLPY